MFWLLMQNFSGMLKKMKKKTKNVNKRLIWAMHIHLICLKKPKIALMVVKFFNPKSLSELG